MSFKLIIDLRKLQKKSHNNPFDRACISFFFIRRSSKALCRNSTLKEKGKTTIQEVKKLGKYIIYSLSIYRECISFFFMRRSFKNLCRNSTLKKKGKTTIQ